MTMHPLVYGHDALPDLLHECIAYHIAPEYCRLPEGVAIQGALHSCNMEFNVPHTALHGCNVFRHAGLPCGIYSIAHIWMIPHSHHAPPVAGKQYTLQDNVPMYALMHCAKSRGYSWNFRQHFPYLTSDVVRCRQMSYQALFTNRLSLSDFVKSESDNGKELTSPDHSTPWTSRSNPTKEDSLFKRTEQVVSLSDKKSFVRQEPTCPAEAGDFSPKSKNQKKWSSQILLSGQTLFKCDLKSNNIVVYKDSNKKIINKKKLYLTISQNGRSISFTDSFVLHIVPFNFHESPITSYSIFGHTTNLHMRGSIVKSLVLATPLALVYPSPFSTTIFPSATTSHSFLCSHRIYPYP